MALFSLLQTRAQIFQTAFNPTSIRTGAKYLRRRIRGPSMLAYYPPKLDISKAIRMYPDLELVDDDEQTRLEDTEYRRKRGKGPPKKQKEGLLILFIFLMHAIAHLWSPQARQDGPLGRNGPKNKYRPFYHTISLHTLALLLDPHSVSIFITLNILRP